jgi:hypothetical protein
MTKTYDPNSFSIVLPSAEYDRNGFYKVTFIEWLTENCPELTVSGIDNPLRTGSGTLIRGVEHAGPNTLLTVGRGPKSYWAA